jgi:hypothetical protein
MSHFFVIAILKKVHANHAEDTIEDLMNPYSEELIVDEYDQDCHCGKYTARRKARDEAEKQFGKTWDMLRADFDKSWKACHSDKMFDKMTDEEKEKSWQSRDSAWKGTYRPLDDLETKLNKTVFEPVAKPDKDCESCKGTGTYKSTYNPKSQWDWYRVGGRWDGTIQCREKELDTDGFNFDDTHEEIKNNILSTRLLAENEVIPFAILTPDGDWHQKGKMGWWGCSTDEMSEEEWKKEALKIYSQHEGKYVGIGLDCHI